MAGTYESWCRGGESNPHGARPLRILSPPRLPVPPPRLKETLCGQRIYHDHLSPASSGQKTWV